MVSPWWDVAGYGWGFDFGQKVVVVPEPAALKTLRLLRREALVLMQRVPAFGGGVGLGFMTVYLLGSLFLLATSNIFLGLTT